MAGDDRKEHPVAIIKTINKPRKQQQEQQRRSSQLAAPDITGWRCQCQSILAVDGFAISAFVLYFARRKIGRRCPQAPDGEKRREGERRDALVTVL